MVKACIIHKARTLDPRSFYKQARSLTKAGYKTSIIGLFGEDKTNDDIDMISIQRAKRRMTGFIVTNYRMFIGALKEKADVYHFHDLDFIPWAILLKVVTRKKIVYDIHEAHPEYMLLKSYLPKYTRRLIAFLIYLLEHSAILFFDAILPNDNNIAAGFNHKNNVTVFNFPTLDFFNEIDNIPWEDREFDLFYHGSLPKYHFETMMNVAEKLNADNVNNKWGIVMSPTSPREWIVAQIHNRKLEMNFTILPYADYLQLYKYLANAKIGIIPLPAYKKFMKNIPMKLFEFMGAGMPVVLSDLPPSRQFIERQNCALSVTPENINEYADAIKSLLSDPDKAVQMGANGRKLIYDKYNWNREEEKLLSLYGRLINN